MGEMDITASGAGSGIEVGVCGMVVDLGAGGKVGERGLEVCSFAPVEIGVEALLGDGSGSLGSSRADSGV